MSERVEIFAALELLIRSSRDDARLVVRVRSGYERRTIRVA